MSNSLEYILEEVVLRAINEAADFSGLPDTLSSLQAGHGHSDDDAPSAVIYIEAKKDKMRLDGRHECVVSIGTKIPLRTPDDTGNAADISAASEDALWEIIEDITDRLGPDSAYKDGEGIGTRAPNALAYATAELGNLDWLYRDNDSKTERPDSEQFRHRIRRIACAARKKNS